MQGRSQLDFALIFTSQNLQKYRFYGLRIIPLDIKCQKSSSGSDAKSNDETYDLGSSFGMFDKSRDQLPTGCKAGLNIYFQRRVYTTRL